MEENENANNLPEDNLQDPQNKDPENPAEEDEQDEEQNQLMYIYEWVDKIQLSRSKRNIARDFSDAVLLAEIIKNYLPRLVELHNYPSVSSAQKKILNWNTLNTKVLKKIGIKMTKTEIQEIVDYKPLAIEKLLARVYEAIQNTTGIDISSGETRSKKQHRDNIVYLKKALEEKENNIRQLKDIIEVLEMKLNSSHEMEQTLERKVNELSDTLRNKGFDV